MSSIYSYVDICYVAMVKARVRGKVTEILYMRCGSFVHVHSSRDALKKVELRIPDVTH